MNKAELELKLSEAVRYELQIPILPPDLRDSHLANMSLLVSELVHPAHLDLRDCLANDPFFSDFDNKMLWCGGSGTGVSLDNFSKWLINEANIIGVDKTIENLNRYFALDYVPGREIMVVSGLEVEGRLRISDDIELVPFEELESSHGKDMLDTSHLLQKGPGYLPLTQPCRVPKIAIIKEKRFPRISYGEHDEPILENCYDELKEICDCFVICFDCTPLPIGYWQEFENWIPMSAIMRSGCSLPSFDVLNMSEKSYKIKSEDADEFSKFLVQYNKKSYEMIRKKLRIPLQRLNQARRRSELADRIIDFGIALEALFLSDRRHTEQISYTFRLRGAWLLGKDASERKDLMKYFREIYNLLKLTDFKPRGVFPGGG